MFGSVGAWFYRALAGIDQPDDGVGYRHIVIRPHAAHGLRWASGTVKTIRGTVESSWSRDPQGVTLKVRVPVGADAQVLVPRPQEMSGVTVEESGKAVWANGQYVPGVAGITGGTNEDDGIVFELGSGEYSFRLKGE
jgi:alpha-L-rhamnosidase